MSSPNPKPNSSLNDAEAAYVKGDFVAAKKAAQSALGDDSLPKEKAAAANGILKAIEFDPIVTVAFGVTLFILVFLAIKFLL